MGSVGSKFATGKADRHSRGVSMVWWREGYGMFVVSAVDDGFELRRVSAESSEVVDRFRTQDEAIRRWDDLEADIRAAMESSK